ncbi:MAG: acyl-CoA dehydrogenase [Proteobacteria bacterium]|nr:acyl-CoA dehydrogenase [Pseudomonadota bacterium]
MSDYVAPIADMRFVLDKLVDLAELATFEGLDVATSDTVDAILTEAARMAGEVMGPLNRIGDIQRSVINGADVTTPDGFKAAYDLFVQGGWNGIMFDPSVGGQGLPWAVSIAVTEMWQSANLAFSLMPMLTQAAVECVAKEGTPEQKATYLSKLVSGEWAGTMNLSEPHAGSDVGAIKTRAVKEGDHYRITGTKIFITFGEHDLTANIVHLVLARTPDAPSGSKGISLFIVPKFLVNGDGSLGARNDLRAVSLEHKLGIHASPTAVMSYGDEGGAIGYLVGEECEGLRSMFIMMNFARLAVGLEGLGIAERAYQQALAYARERRQGRALGDADPQSSLIIQHPDVRRMLMLMKASNEAMRGMAYIVGGAKDRAERHPDEAIRRQQHDFADLMTPVIKGWFTDLGVELASLGVQVHGGVGYVEETGAAQHFRDARIAPIYEGTNGIQAFDLVMRKLPRAGGEAVRRVIEEIKSIDSDLGATNNANFVTIRRALNDAATAFEEATDWLIEKSTDDPRAAAAGATPYLRLFGTTYGGFVLAKSALAANAALADRGDDVDFMRAKIATARFYAEQILAPVPSLVRSITAGTEALFQIEPELMSL